MIASGSEIIIFESFPNCEINYGWGQTETGIGTNNILSRADFEKDEGVRLLSIGRAAPFIELRIVDEQGRCV
jgi:long-chain acyl-CoA synthetase